MDHRSLNVRFSFEFDMIQEDWGLFEYTSLDSSLEFQERMKLVVSCQTWRMAPH